MSVFNKVVNTAVGAIAQVNTRLHGVEADALNNAAFGGRLPFPAFIRESAEMVQEKSGKLIDNIAGNLQKLQKSLGSIDHGPRHR